MKYLYVAAVLCSRILASQSVPLQRQAGANDFFLAQFLDDADGGEAIVNDEDNLRQRPGPNYAYDGKPDFDAYKRGQKEEYLDEEDLYYGAAIFCRMRIYPYALNPDKCSEVKIADYDPDILYDNPHKNESSGYCYWDVKLGKHQQSGCLCPRPKRDCQKKKECYWHVLPDVDNQGRGPRHNGGDRTPLPYHEKPKKGDGQCIHNSERFYNILAKLLAKRGKKDLSLKIQYSSAPAKGKLPYGPHGPAIVGFGTGLDERYKLFSRLHNPGPHYGFRYRGVPYGRVLQQKLRAARAPYWSSPVTNMYGSRAPGCACPPLFGLGAPLQQQL